MSSTRIDELCVNTIRFLSVDAVQKAKSGHPGMPLGCAPIAYTLFSKFMRFNPANPDWFGRDRFILSAGHGSMLLYSTLHLAGYDISLDDLKDFRQMGSRTPGHPEYGKTPGVETTTGPLGQGFTNAVGIAMANKYWSAKFSREGFDLFDQYVYVIASDGDLMEGISHEAASLAGHLKLGRLIVFYDDNQISIDGCTDLSLSDDAQKRFEAYGWHTLRVEDGNDLSALSRAVEEAQKVTDRPTIILTRTIIGYGSPNKQGKSSCHGSPLGPDEIVLTKKFLGWDPEKHFYVPDEVREFFSHYKNRGLELENCWNELVEKYCQAYPEEGRLLKEFLSGSFSSDWKSLLPEFSAEDKKIATRSASGKVLNAIAPGLPGLLGGSADLTPSNNTYLNGLGDYSPKDYTGRNLHYGVREHAMASIMNGMALYGPTLPYAGTFLVFSDYMKPAIRLAALSELQAVYVFTHDSIGVGEDGPTHQPIEHLAMLRAIPGLTVIRPADANETSIAWKAAVEHKSGPTALILTRQDLPIIDQQKFAPAEGVEKGAYVLSDSPREADMIIMATGSEVQLALKAQELLSIEGIEARVVSFPSWELFEKQSADYKESVLPASVKVRLSVEAGLRMGWDKYLGDSGDAVSIEHFGASAPAEKLFEHYGFTAENVAQKAKALLARAAKLNGRLA